MINNLIISHFKTEQNAKASGASQFLQGKRCDIRYPQVVPDSVLKSCILFSNLIRGLTQYAPFLIAIASTLRAYFTLGTGAKLIEPVNLRKNGRSPNPTKLLGISLPALNPYENRANYCAHN